ncbi:hypothetical protein evm_011538 [Chilo suppressalis]|nr:hypothetical protein evm_011538 [Chilo suppressalis]
MKALRQARGKSPLRKEKRDFLRSRIQTEFVVAVLEAVYGCDPLFCAHTFLLPPPLKEVFCRGDIFPPSGGESRPRFVVFWWLPLLRD